MALLNDSNVLVQPTPATPAVTKHVYGDGADKTVYLVDRDAKTVHIEAADGTVRFAGGDVETMAKLPLLSDAPEGHDEGLVTELSAQMVDLNNAVKGRLFQQVKDSAKIVSDQCDKIMADAKEAQPLRDDAPRFPGAFTDPTPHTDDKAAQPLFVADNRPAVDKDKAAKVADDVKTAKEKS
jgi:hypothetical protein